MNKTRQTIVYVVCDLLSAVASWTLFFYLRNEFLDAYYLEYPDLRGKIMLDINFRHGLVLIPLLWIGLYYLSGYYREVCRKSRLKELVNTVLVSFVGSLILFFSIILNDNVATYQAYYYSYLILFFVHFSVTYVPRLLITSRTRRKIITRKIGFNTLLIGSNDKAEQLYKRLESAKKSAGNKFIGFVNVMEQPSYQMERYMPHLGTIDQVKEILTQHNVQEIIISIDATERTYIEKILNLLLGTKAIIRAIPDNCDIITGRASIDSIHDEPLIVISQNVMPIWQEKLKRECDIIVSILVLLVGSPLYLITAVLVKISSKGPVFYKQERIGQYGKPFFIYKFRSMYTDAEDAGPQLSSEHDDRITPWGHTMRKFRIDEIPQFFNVLKGDMSLVGPRPERQYFIDQIVKISPHYTHLHKVRPGITSLGQVKFGYAQSPEEMVRRMKYDIIYIEHMSIYLDLKILVYTIKTVLSGEGV